MIHISFFGSLAYVIYAAADILPSLGCRNLMAKQELSELGLEGLYDTEGISVVKDKRDVRGQQGFVAGMRMQSGVADSDPK